ncbi:ste ste20 ysk protein kinase [Moniliophthora roreri]|nr:ste ste20 ysk protein kinase [Moniliophthora roreri]
MVWCDVSENELTGRLSFNLLYSIGTTPQGRHGENRTFTAGFLLPNSYQALIWIDLTQSCLTPLCTTVLCRSTWTWIDWAFIESYGVLRVLKGFQYTFHYTFHRNTIVNSIHSDVTPALLFPIPFFLNTLFLCLQI